jgi:hypothetical protein
VGSDVYVHYTCPCILIFTVGTRVHRHLPSITPRLLAVLLDLALVRPPSLRPCVECLVAREPQRLAGVSLSDDSSRPLVVDVDQCKCGEWANGCGPQTGLINRAQDMA